MKRSASTGFPDGPGGSARYMGPQEHKDKLSQMVDSADVPEEAIQGKHNLNRTNVSSSGVHRGGPLSALTPSMWPERISEEAVVDPDKNGGGQNAEVSGNEEVEDRGGRGDDLLDEFGFRLDEDDFDDIRRISINRPELDDTSRSSLPVTTTTRRASSSSRFRRGRGVPRGTLVTPISDDPKQRLKWIAHLEFAQNSAPAGPGAKAKDQDQDHDDCDDGGRRGLRTAAQGLLAWDTIVKGISRTNKLREMVRQGIPHSLRPYIWMRLAGAMAKRASSELRYGHIVKASMSGSDHLTTSKQIEKDLLRTLPTNVCFSSKRSTGVPRLRRILRGLAWLYPDIGYCQGMGMIAAMFLLIMEEEDAFWMMTAVIEELLPPSYYSPSLIGVQADQMVLRGLIASCLPAVDTLLQEHDIELSLVTLNWFLTLFASVLHIRVLVRLWDLLLFEGTKVLFQASLAMIAMKEAELLKADNSAEIFNIISLLPNSVVDVDLLFETMLRTCCDPALVSDVIIEESRRRHVSSLLSKQGSWRSNLETHHRFHRSGGGPTSSDWRGKRLFKRSLKRSMSVMDMMGFGVSGGQGGGGGRRQSRLGLGNRGSGTGYDDDDDEDVKSKNIKRTEIMIRLRDAILRVSRYFQAADPNQHSLSQEDKALQADYSMDGHARDHDAYMSISKSKRKRARALVDFERRDDDELGFRKNDILTIVSQRDEHCWVGELNGCTGWFPAKMVRLLDERSKEYCFAGDDSVSNAVTDLVRGCLCPAIKAVLDHGLRRRSPLLSGPVHPWVFVEEAASKEVERDFRSVYSRLVLCKTFRLHEDGKVLSPEELLYRCVEAVNHTHVHAPMDVKLRSLICLGLNEQVLHLWLEVLASNEEVVRKFYSQQSFIGSPGWVQIKCELRLLSRFSFNLNPDWELAGSGRLRQGDHQAGQGPLEGPAVGLGNHGVVGKGRPSGRPRLQLDFTSGELGHIQEGVREMMVKHHLFSWDL